MKLTSAFDSRSASAECLCKVQRLLGESEWSEDLPKQRREFVSRRWYGDSSLAFRQGFYKAEEPIWYFKAVFDYEYGYYECSHCGKSKRTSEDEW